MNSSRRRAVVVSGLMFAGAGAAVLARPTRHMADEIGKPDLEAIFPRAFGDWREDTSMPVIQPAPDVQAMLDKIYNQVLTRTYIDSQGQRIMLSVAYGGDQSDGTSAHRPEVCYPAQGFAVTANSPAVLHLAGRDVQVRRLMSTLGPRYEPITYWVVVGDRVATTGIGQKLAQMRHGLRGVIADGMLVRVSSIDKDMAHGHAVQERFLADLAAFMEPKVATRVFGAG